MHGHHGWGHHGGGHWCGGGGFGWFLPALLLGRLFSDGPRAYGWPYPPQPAPGPWGTPQQSPQPQTTQAAPKTRIRCENCAAEVDGTYAYCPHCGEKVAQRACRYCGQALEPGAKHCGYCGGSVK